MTSITVVTPWLNHRELERDYWAALRTEDCEVIVVDNGSEPPLPNAWRMDHNSGFSHASNVGMELARTDAVLFLNNDIFATAPGWLEPIRAALEPGVLCGPVLRYDEHGNVDGHQLPYVDGWCLAGMRQDLIDIGGWDENYQEPSYFGDNDLSFRARLAGMTLRETPTSICHLASRTSADLDESLHDPLMASNYARFASLVRDALGVAA